MLVEKLLAFEKNELSADEIVVLFQMLINTGLLYKLPAIYAMTAEALLEEGFIVENVDRLH